MVSVEGVIRIFPSRYVVDDASLSHEGECLELANTKSRKKVRWEEGLILKEGWSLLFSFGGNWKGVESQKWTEKANFPRTFGQESQCQ